MRTTLDLDARLLKKAMVRARTHTKTETIEQGLRELIRAAERGRFLTMRGRGYGMSLRRFLRHRLDE